MTNNPANEPASIYQYDDYRDFLKARFLEMKESSPKFSYRYLARKIDSTDNYFKNVFDKKRNVGLDRVSKVATAFKLDAMESRLLTYHVLFHSITDPELKAVYSNHIQTLRLRRQQFLPIRQMDAYEASAYKITSSWLTGTIMELFHLSDFMPTAEYVKSKLIDGAKYTNTVLEEALNKIINSGLVENKDGRWHVVSHFIYAPDKSTEEEYLMNKSLMEKGLEFVSHPVMYDPYLHAAGTFAINSSDKDLVLKAMGECTQKIVKIIGETKNPDMLMSFSNFAYTLTK